MKWGRSIAMIAALIGLGGAIHFALVDFYLNRVFDGGQAERTQGQYDALRESVRTLILGDSHAKWGIAASELEDAFNLALDGQTAPESYYVLKSELANPAVSLRTVILPADSLTFSAWQADAFAYRHWYASRIDYCELGRIRGDRLRFGVNGLLGRYAPYVGKRYQMLRHLVTGHAPQLAVHLGLEMVRGSYLARGAWSDTPAAERREIAQRRVEIHFPDSEFDEVAGAYFRRTLELAQDEGVAVLVVRFPLSQEYLLAARPFNQSARVDEHLGEILADHPEVRVFDARLDYAGRPQVFIDPDHLNGIGARRFTRRIGRILAGGES